MITLSLTEAQALYIGSAITLVTGIVSFLGLYIRKLPAMQDQTTYDWTMRGLNGVLNLVAIILAELTLGSLDWHNWLAYVGLAAAGGVGAHVLYKVTTAPKSAEIKNLQAAQAAQTPPAVFGGLNDVKIGVS